MSIYFEAQRDARQVTKQPTVDLHAEAQAIINVIGEVTALVMQVREALYGFEPLAAVDEVRNETPSLSARLVEAREKAERLLETVGTMKQNLCG